MDDHLTTPGQRTDAELLAAHIAGDTEAFGELFARHRDRLWAIALRTMGNPHDAADGLQDAMVAAFRRAGSFRGEAAVTTWLHRVVVNACLDRLRAAKVRAHDALPDDLDQPNRGAVISSSDAHTDPEALAALSERRAAVIAALAALPAEQRAALVLVDMEGYSIAEVALMLECAEGTIKSRCARGRARLAADLGLLQVVRDTAAPGNPPGSLAVPSGSGSRAPPHPKRV